MKYEYSSRRITKREGDTATEEATLCGMRKWNKDHPVEEDRKEAIEKQIALAVEIACRSSR